MLDQSHPGEAQDAVPTLLPFARSENEVLRSATIRALGAFGDSRAREVFRDALMDPDPDVRTDAMIALRRVARADDAEAVRASLQGDPVREVKEAALALLADLEDQQALPLVERLVADRAEDLINWEDEAGTWDEWLEIQAFAVEALGRMGATDAIETLMTARDDAGGDLDPAVFEALTRMGLDGNSMLLAVVETEPGLGRKRALDALARGDADALRPFAAGLLVDENAAVRRLSVPLFEASDPEAVQLALHDADAAVRAFAVSAYAPNRPELAIAALSDKSEAVQAVALQHLPLQLEPDLLDTLIANLRLWLKNCGPALAGASAQCLATLAPQGCSDDLLALAGDADRPLDARVAAVHALAGLDDPGGIAALRSLLNNPARQVRAAALADLAAHWTETPGIPELFDAAIRMELLTDAEIPEPSPDDGRPSAATPRVEAGDRPIRITPDGDIVELEDEQHTGSTLAAITRRETPPDPDVQSEGPALRKRVDILGPSDIAADLGRLALCMVADMPLAENGTVLLTACHSPDVAMARDGYKVLRDRARLELPLPVGVDTVLRGGLESIDPSVRAVCLELLSGAEDAVDIAREHLNDEDAEVRLQALRMLGSDAQDAATVALRDKSPHVRTEALDILCRADVPSMDLIESVLATGQSALLAQLFLSRSEAVATALRRLRTQPDRVQDCTVLLRAFEDAGPRIQATAAG